MWSKRRIHRARRCATRCDKRHSGVNCKLVRMRLAVCGQGAGCGEKWLLHLPSEQLVHLGCPSSCSTAWTGRRAPENEAPRPPLRSASPSSSALCTFSWMDRQGQLGIPITADWGHPHPPLLGLVQLQVRQGGSESTVNVTKLRVRVLMYLSRARATELSRLDGIHTPRPLPSVYE